MVKQQDPVVLELVQQTLAGSQEAFDCLIDRYRPRLVAHAKRSPHWRVRRDAEDLIQDLICHLADRQFRRLRSWSQNGTFDGWLFRCFRHLIIDFLRSGGPRTELPLAQELPDLSPSPDRVVESIERLRVLVKVARFALSPLERQALMLNLQGLRAGQISQRLRVTPNHVNVLVHRARRKLRQADLATVTPVRS